MLSKCPGIQTTVEDKPIIAKVYKEHPMILKP